MVRALGDHASSYKKGLICESHGYGIGAHAYYRRIVENIVNWLLEQVGDLLASEEHAGYAEPLGRA